MTKVVTGNDFELAVELTKDGRTFAIPPGSVLQAALVSRDHSAALTPPVTVDLAAPGSDPAGSLIIVTIGKEQTGAITRYGPAKLEIEMKVYPGTPQEMTYPSWFVDVHIVKSNI